jgi:hypothetical protein
MPISQFDVGGLPLRHAVCAISLIIHIPKLVPKFPGLVGDVLTILPFFLRKFVSNWKILGVRLRSAFCRSGLGPCFPANREISGKFGQICNFSENSDGYYRVKTDPYETISLDTRTGKFEF